MHDLLSPRTPAILWTESDLESPGSISFIGQHSCESGLGLSITVQRDHESVNPGCTPRAGCWRHVSDFHPYPVSSCSVVASLQHARCRIVVTQIPVGSSSSVHS